MYNNLDYFYNISSKGIFYYSYLIFLENISFQFFDDVLKIFNTSIINISLFCYVILDSMIINLVLFMFWIL